MSGNSFGKLFTVTTFGESHGKALGCILDGCPPGIEISEEEIQVELDLRKPGTSKFTTQRREPDQVKILSGVFEGKTTGTPIGMLIENTDQRSKDYGDIAQKFRPAHADYGYTQNTASVIIGVVAAPVRVKQPCVWLPAPLLRSFLRQRALRFVDTYLNWVLLRPI